MTGQKRSLEQGLSKYITFVSRLLKVTIPFALLVACHHEENSTRNTRPLTGTVYQTNKKQIAILLPLTGRNGALGNNMLKAARLAIRGTALDVYDTALPGGVREAASQAVNKDRIILGPLTGRDTAQVVSVARDANVPVLSYSSDVSVAGSNVWVLGITPEQQVLALVKAAKNEGRTKFAAFLPDNAFGRAMADGLIKSCSDLGLMQPVITYHTANKADIEQKMKSLSDYDARLTMAKNDPAAQQGKTQDGAADAGKSHEDNDSLQDELIPSSKAKETASVNKGQNLTLGKPPFDALLLADTGLQLQSVIDALQESQVSTDQVRIMGPGLWASFVGKLAKLKGAWYAAPAPSQRQEFVREYMARYGQSPKPLADLAYDSAAMVNALPYQAQGYSVDNLTRPQGFNGVDGYFVLKPDGLVKRNLRLFEIQPFGGGKLLPASE